MKLSDNCVALFKSLCIDAAWEVILRKLGATICEAGLKAYRWPAERRRRPYEWWQCQTAAWRERKRPAPSLYVNIEKAAQRGDVVKFVESGSEWGGREWTVTRVKKPKPKYRGARWLVEMGKRQWVWNDIGDIKVWREQVEIFKEMDVRGKLWLIEPADAKCVSES